MASKSAANCEDSDSDMSLNEDDFKETSVDIGLLDADLDDLTSDELKLFHIQMRSPFFPCKVGGKPAWLDFGNVPLAIGNSLDEDDQEFRTKNSNNIKLECESCRSQLLFLLQIYAPIMDNDKFNDHIEKLDDVFHRVLYVFLCSNRECAPGSRTFKVLRSQLNRENEYFSFDPPPAAELADDNNNDQIELAKSHLKSFYKNLRDKKLMNLCALCGLTSSKKCSRCSFSLYCSQSHQLFDWKNFNHKNLCNRYLSSDDDELLSNWIDDENSMEKNPQKDRNEYLFPEYEIIIEPESLDFNKLKEKEFKYDEKKLAENLELNSGAGMDQELDALKENDYDNDFEKFKKISAQEPTQVVRYERGGEPLWTTKYEKIKSNQVRPCEYCGAKRIFEFQVTPQLLNYLNLEEINPMNSLDWAGLYVYTCVRSCKAATNSYAYEYIYKQDFVS